jgi:hypothetical protein
VVLEPVRGTGRFSSQPEELTIPAAIAKFRAELLRCNFNCATARDFFGGEYKVARQQ